MHGAKTECMPAGYKGQKVSELTVQQVTKVNGLSATFPPIYIYCQVVPY